MRRLGPVLAAATLAATLAGCGKSDSGKPAESGAAAPAPVELSAADKQKILASLPAPYNAADLANGEAQFGLCKSCHTTVAGGPNMTGPNLHGVVGLKAGTEPADFKYSDALKAANITWDLPTLDQWIADPKAMVKDTKMTFVGLKDPTARRDVVAYLAVETGNPPK